MPISPALIIGITAALILFLMSMELVVPVPLLPSLEKTIGMTRVQAAWGLSAFTIAQAASLALLCRLGDIVGLRKILLGSLIFMVIGNAMCSAASGPVMFIAGRAVAGASAAEPMVFALLRLRSDSNGRVDKASGLSTAAIGFGVAFSFLLGGIVLAAGGTARTAMWIMTGVSAAAFLLAWLFMPESATRTRVSVDYMGASFIAVALSALIIGIGQGNSWGWASARVVGLFALCGVLLIAWVVWESRVPKPLINMRLFRRREMWPAFVTAGIAGLLGPAIVLTVANYIETPKIVGYGVSGSVLTAGLLLLPMGVLIAFGGSLAEPVIRRLGHRNTAVLGCALSAASSFWFSVNYSQEWAYLVDMAVFGVAWALMFGATLSAYLRAARPGEGGMVTGAARAVSMGFTSLGPAIVTALITASFIPRLPVHVPQGGNYRHVWIFFGITSVIALGISLLIRNTTTDQTLAADTEIVGREAAEVATDEPAAPMT